MTVWWIDASAGASGDMLLGALLGLEPQNLAKAQAAVDEVLERLGASEAVTLTVEPADRGGLACTRARVQCDDHSAHRRWADIAPALADQPGAYAVFESLATAEAQVHGVPVADIHFHEVGALDAIADIVAATTLHAALAPARIVVSPVCVGSGWTDTSHGRLSVPGPAVTRLLQGVPTFAGPVAHEACTPTGAALLRFLADEWGPQPAMAVDRSGVGAGGRETPGQPNVLRILAGSPSAQPVGVVMVETTIDDLDPRVYPDVLEVVKDAGALETWLTPVIMKQGRPGVTLSAVVPPHLVDAVSETLFRHTTTLGVRQTPVHRTVLDRDHVDVDVQGQTVSVKRGILVGEVVNVQPELRDAQAASRALEIPLREVLDQARAEALMTMDKKRVRTPPTGETATSEQFKT